MDPFNAGALSLLPPIIAITLALWTKEVFSSLMIGILSGSLIYTVGMGQDFVIVRTIETAFAVMVKKVDFNIIIFCTLLGSPCSPPVPSARSSLLTTISTALP